HYAIDKSGERKGPDKRKFEYVVVVGRDRTGAFWLEEYRNGSTDHEQFPAHLATLGLPAIVLLFHPDFAADFNFQCEGLVRDEGREYWRPVLALFKPHLPIFASLLAHNTFGPHFSCSRLVRERGKRAI